MAITPTCDYCPKELNDFGAILLSPPTEDGWVSKFHVCRACYERIKPR